MGTCEEANPPFEVETHNEITLETSSNATTHPVVILDGDVDDRDQVQNPIFMEETAIVEQLENLELQPRLDAANTVKEEEEEVEQVQVQVVKQEEAEAGKISSYPVRLNAADCAFYIKTGTCKYGLFCRFNHPPKRVFKPVGEKEKGSEELNGIVSDEFRGMVSHEFKGMVPDATKVKCKYFSTPGGCKYGDACKYDHSLQKIERKDSEFNFLGLPIRPREKECTFYMRTGTCAYGANCRFNHPDPTAANEVEPENSLANGHSLRGDNYNPKANEQRRYSGSSQHTSSNGTTSKNSLPYASKMESYNQRMPQNPGWNQDQGIANLSVNKTLLPHQMVSLSKNADPVPHHERLMHIEEFPERPGEPDCDFFMKTGDCKYRSACRFNHPISRSTTIRHPPLSSNSLHSKRSVKVSPVETSVLRNSNFGNTMINGMYSANHQKLQNEEYPDRPGQPECEFFMKMGNCKFKSACRYHHPRSGLRPSSPSPLSEKGLPLRPGAKICRNYEQQGRCQYGRKCLFHHPDNLSPVPQNHHHSSTNITGATDFGSRAGNNASDWGDGWVM